jgi:UDP-4-amino-4,6-dideoxy-N-acetyl-beta-L-altrosamine transaminase
MINIPYSMPEITNSDIKRVTSVLKNGYLTQGKEIISFESAITDEFNCKYSMVCNSGTAALHLAYSSLQIGPKNGLLTSPITFLATANAAKMCNAKVVFCDVDEVTGLMTPEKIEKAILASKIHIKVISVVHLGGRVCDMEAISQIAKKYNCYLVEDASHAAGAFYNNSNPVGCCKYSDATTFSFNAIKHIAMGEGGCVTTNNKLIAEEIIKKRSHGMVKNKEEFLSKLHNNAPWYYEMQYLGWNYRADEMSCALGLSQLKRLKKNIKKRNTLADFYFKYLSGINHLNLPLKNDYLNNNAWHLFPINIDFNKLKISREKLMKELAYKGIGTQVHYIPLYLQPYYKQKNIKKYEGASEYYEKTLSIPLHTKLKKEDIIFISKNIRNILK